MTDNNLNSPNEINFFAQTNFRNRMTKFGIKRDDRRRHMYLIGKTGMGKSNALENMVISDVQAGNGVCLIDPHGDAAEKILDFIPTNRANDVVYFNPSDIDFPIAFNILETVDPARKHLIASGLIGIFKKIWADSWGPRLEYLLRNAILALLDYQGSTLLGITRLLVNKTYRKKIIERIQDPVVKSFWVDEYSKYPDRFQTEAIAPIQNKVGQFLSNSLIRNIIGQVKSTIDMREIMDNKKILIVNLSKGRIGEDTSALLGAMIITKIYLSAMSRVNIQEDTRQDFYVYVDEFQNFATESFADILSEARKYRLNLIIAHQYIEQLDEKVTAAVFGNVGTVITFRVGATDAEILAKEFAPDILEEDLVSLSKYNIYLRLMIDGVASSPFSATTLPPIGEMTNNHEKLIKISRERYANNRVDVENKISRWTESTSDTVLNNEKSKIPPVSYNQKNEKTFNNPVHTVVDNKPYQGQPTSYKKPFQNSGANVINKSFTSPQQPLRSNEKRNIINNNTQFNNRPKTFYQPTNITPQSIHQPVNVAPKNVYQPTNVVHKTVNQPMNIENKTSHQPINVISKNINQPRPIDLADKIVVDNTPKKRVSLYATDQPYKRELNKKEETFQPKESEKDIKSEELQLHQLTKGKVVKF